MRLEEKPPEKVVTGRDMVYWYFDWVDMGSQVWCLHSFCLQFLLALYLFFLFFFFFVSFLFFSLAHWGLCLPISSFIGLSSLFLLFFQLVFVLERVKLLFLVLPYIILSYLTSHHHLSLALLETFFFPFFPFFQGCGFAFSA